MVIILTILVVLPYTMLAEEDFKVFTIYGNGGHVGHGTQLICINFHSHPTSSFHMNFGSKSPNCFSEKTSFNFEI